MTIQKWHRRPKMNTILSIHGKKRRSGYVFKPKPSNRFKKNYVLMEKRGYDMTLIDEIIETLLAGKPLPPSKRDHALHGNWAGFRECHVLPDWLLIYKVDGASLLLYLERTGTHSDLF